MKCEQPPRCKSGDLDAALSVTWPGLGTQKLCEPCARKAEQTAAGLKVPVKLTIVPLGGG